MRRIFKKNLSVKNLNYSKIKQISTNFGKPVPLLKDLLEISKNKHSIFIEIKPLLTKTLLKKLMKETSKFTKCVFISFKHKNIFRLLSIKKNTKVGLSFHPPTSVKKIIKKSNDKKINYLILDKSYLKNTKIQNHQQTLEVSINEMNIDFNIYKVINIADVEVQFKHLYQVQSYEELLRITD